MSGNVGEAPATESEMLRGTVSQLQSRLPIGWRAFFSEGLQGKRSETNEVLEVLSPSGQKCTLGLLVKQIVELRDVPRLVEDATKMTSLSSIEKILVVSRFGKTEVEVAAVGAKSVKTVNGNSYSVKTGSPWGRPDSYTSAYKIA